MTKLVNIHLYLFQVPMILAVLLSPFLLTIEMWIISFIIGYMISMLQMEIGLHRYFSHSSFYTNKIIHNILSFLSTATLRVCFVCNQTEHGTLVRCKNCNRNANVSLRGIISESVTISCHCLFESTQSDPNSATTQDII